MIGNFDGTQGLQPPPDSWASNPSNNVGVYYLEIPKSGSVTLKATSKGTNRSLFFLSGTPRVNSEALEPNSFIEAVEDADLVIENPTKTPLECLVLQGNPIGEPVAQRGPFVMNTQQEIMQAHSDYQKTRFGGWPWDQDAVVFPRDVGRFVKVNGKKEVPPKK
jgi:redox-sensitive bicupin YhaK (pirin superfamily)